MLSTNTFIEQAITSDANVQIYLCNGVKLVGKILAQDEHAVVVNGKNGAENLVFRHAISTIVLPQTNGQATR